MLWAGRAPLRTDTVETRGSTYPAGIGTVIVNGTVVIDGGEHTGALPGRLLRRRGTVLA